MSNRQVTRNTHNLTMRLPLDLLEHARRLARGGSLKPVIVAALREVWRLPEPVAVVYNPPPPMPAVAPPGDLGPARVGLFATHNCWKCLDGRRPCVFGNPNHCHYPQVRND